MCYPKTSIRFRDHENATKLRTSILAFKLLVFTVNTKPGKHLSGDTFSLLSVFPNLRFLPFMLNRWPPFWNVSIFEVLYLENTGFFIPLTRFWLRALTHVNFSHVNKIVARGKIKRAELKRESERGSTFPLTSDLSCIASISFANVNFTHVRK